MFFFAVDNCWSLGLNYCVAGLVAGQICNWFLFYFFFNQKHNFETLVKIHFWMQLYASCCIEWLLVFLGVIIMCITISCLEQISYLIKWPGFVKVNSDYTQDLCTVFLKLIWINDRNPVWHPSIKKPNQREWENVMRYICVIILKKKEEGRVGARQSFDRGKRIHVFGMWKGAKHFLILIS